MAAAAVGRPCAAGAFPSLASQTLMDRKSLGPQYNHTWPPALRSDTNFELALDIK